MKGFSKIGVFRSFEFSTNSLAGDWGFSDWKNGAVLSISVTQTNGRQLLGM